ncbi:universal stress protein [Streptomyces sp. NPDC102462]|uniref:universal stress protein n=1 Tax=Streptomyces sp. NPDC102462 TaxID=3366178 RepID=UPI0038206377
MDRPIVAGVDGSEHSLRAVDLAADEAALRRVPLKVVYGSLWERYEGAALAHDLGRPSGQVTGEHVLASAVLRARRRQDGLRVTAESVPEEAEYALIRESRLAAAVVVGSRGRGGLAEALLGSVATTVAGRAHGPVIVVRGGPGDRAGSEARGRVVVGVGEKPADSAAVRFALDEARLRGVPLDVVRAWRTPAFASADSPLFADEPDRLYAQLAAEALDEALRQAPADVRVHRHTVEGPARRVLAEFSGGADLLVVGARQRDGHFGLRLGRVAHGVLHHAACPVAVVPQPG